MVYCNVGYSLVLTCSVLQNHYIDLKLKVRIEFLNTWGEFKNHSNLRWPIGAMPISTNQTGNTEMEIKEVDIGMAPIGHRSSPCKVIGGDSGHGGNIGH